MTNTQHLTLTHKIARFIAESVDGLTNDDATCYRLHLGKGVSVYVGWLDGYDPNDEDYFHASDSPTWCANIGLKIDGELLWCDYDNLTNADGCEDCTLTKDDAKDAYLSLASAIADDYERLA